MTHWPKTPVEIGGRRYDLCFTLGAIAEAQQRFDRRGVEASLLEAMPVLNLANVRILFPCTLRKYHPELDFASARQLVTWEAVYTIAGALRTAWHAAAPDPEPHDSKKGKAQHLGQPEPLSRDRQWQRLWSLALYDLRLSTNDDFYALTIGQLDALIRRHERAIHEREFLFGQLASVYVNFSMAHPKEPVHARDFMPSEWAKQAVTAQPKRRLNRQKIADGVRASMEHLMRNSRG